MRYTSSVRFLGLPLFEIAIGDRKGRARAACAWIALGDVAVGGLFAAGGIATGTVAIGGLTAGVVPLGGLAIGLFAIGGLTAGVWAIGGAAFAWQGAIGGLAVAAQYALGGAGFAAHTNDAAATAYFAAGPFPVIRDALRHARWLWLLSFVPLLFAQRLRRGSSEKPIA